MAEDLVNSPKHYKIYGPECIELVRHLPYPQGCAIGYIWRFPFKGDPRQDLEKAIWYIDDISSTAAWLSMAQDGMSQALWASMQYRLEGMHAMQRNAISAILSNQWLRAKTICLAMLADMEPILEDQLHFAERKSRRM